MRWVSLAVALLFGGCASDSHRPWIEIRPAQAYQVCAQPHDDFKQKHRHVKFFFLVHGEGVNLAVTVNDTTRFDFVTSQVTALEYPAGIGVHTIHAVLQGQDGKMLAEAETVVSVWGCDE